jgi:hypothetical protein
LKRLYQVAGLLLVITASIYFFIYLIENWSKLPANIFELKQIPTLLAVTFCYLSCFLITSKAWYTLLYSVGEKPKLLPLLKIILLSQFAKYLPGNFAHHISRAVLARNAVKSNNSIAITMLLELILVILAACGVAVIAISFDQSISTPQFMDVPTLGKVSVFSLITLLGLAFIYLSKSNFEKVIMSQFRFSEATPYKILGRKIQYLIECFFLYTINFLLLGAILYLLTESFFSNAQANYWLFTGLFSIAWILGFITPGAPAGLGVREAILVTALDPIYGPGVALSLTLSLRIVTTMGDGLGFLIGLLLKKYLKPNSITQISIK